MNTTYQLARAADARIISEMSQSIIEAGLRPSWPPSRVLWHIHDRESVVLTGAIDDEVVAFAIMQFGDTRAHLNLLGVQPMQQRLGVGRHMLRWLEETARTAGTFVINLELRASNRAAHAFYTACDYRQVGLVAGYYQGQDAAIKMSRDLQVACSNKEHRP